MNAEFEKEQGNKEYKKRNFSKALDHYNRAIQLDPKNIIYFNNKAAVFYEQNKINECIEECKKAIEIGRKEKADLSAIAKSYARMGNAYYKKKDYENALKNYESSLGLCNNTEITKRKEIAERDLKMQNVENFLQKENGAKENAKQKPTKEHPRADEYLSERQMENNALLNDEEFLLINSFNDHLLEFCPPSILNEFLDTRIPPFHQELKNYPKNCDVSKCKSNLESWYTFARTRKFHYFKAKKTGQVENLDMIKRLGSTDSKVMEWYCKTTKFGDICETYPYIPYNPGIFHSFANEVVRSEIYTAGTVHVSIGFTDLSMFYKALFNENLSKYDSFSWIGFEASAYCAAKTSIITAMCIQKANVDEILQVWYSAAWSNQTLEAFNKAIEFLLNNKQKFACLENNKIIKLLNHWKSNKITLSEARKKWLESCTDAITLIANFKEVIDRRVLCEYYLTGQLLDADLGSTIMFSMPDDYVGEKAINEFIFNTIDYNDLMKLRMQKFSNIMDAAIDYLKTGIRKICDLLIEEKLRIDIHFQMVDLSNKQVTKFISSLNPFTISWSNVSDYMSPEDFHKLARQCSCEKTVHFTYSMNWKSKVQGTCFMDYILFAKDAAERLDGILNKANEAFSDSNKLVGYDKILLDEPVDDPRNIIDYILYMPNREKWVNYFFSKGNFKDIKRQTFTEKKLYNFFARANTTIYFVFSYHETLGNK